MQKQKVAKIFFISLVIILLISFIFLFKEEKKNRTKDMYKKICNSKIYTFTIEEGIPSSNKFIISKMGENRSLDLISEGEHTTTLVKDGYAYFIMHNKEEYSIFENSDKKEIDANILENELNIINNSNYLSNKEKIYGKTYYYEEYENIDCFIMSGISINEESTIKTRFYFNGDKIVYIKTIIYDEEEQNEELLKVNLSSTANEDLFEIPKKYAEL